MNKKKFYIHYDKSTPNWAVSLRLKDFKSQSIGAQIAVFNGHALHLNLGGYAGADRIAEALNKQLQEEEEEDTTGEDDEKLNSNIIIGQDAVVGFSTDDRELGIVKEIKFKEMGGEDLLMIRVKTYVTKQNYWWDCNNVQLVALNLR